MLQEQTDSSVIGSDRVEGTTVYGVDKGKIGSVDKLLIDKRGGNVTDVVISAGGFLAVQYTHGIALISVLTGCA